MGASTSEVSEPVESLLEQGRQLITDTTAIISRTVQQEMSEVRDYEEIAARKAAATLETGKQRLAELGEYEAYSRKCVEKKEADMQGVSLKMKKNLAECYQKHYASLDKFRAKRAIIHEQATQLKYDVQQIISNCMASNDRLNCFQAGLKEMNKKVGALLKKIEKFTEDEMKARAKATAQVYECDKKAMDEAHKRYSQIIGEIKKCIAEAK